MLDFKDAFKKPWVRYSMIGIASLGFVYIVYARISGGSSSAAVQSSTGLTDAQAADMTQLSEQQNAISAQASSQASSQSYGLQTTQLNDQTQLAALTNNNQTQIALAGVQLQGLQSTLTAQTTQQANQINGVVTQAQIMAGEQEAISNNQTQVAIVQSNNQAGVANNQVSTNASVANNSSNNNLLGALATTAAFAFF